MSKDERKVWVVFLKTEGESERERMKIATHPHQPAQLLWDQKLIALNYFNWHRFQENPAVGRRQDFGIRDLGRILKR